MQIGHISDFKDGLNEINIHHQKFFLMKTNDALKLYQAICPHQGGQLHVCESEAYCKVHNWRFNLCDGKSSNIKNAQLVEHSLYIDNLDNVYYTGGGGGKPRTITESCNALNLTISLHAHATLELKSKNFTLLCDPWIDGLAFFGAWRHYPKPIIKTKDLHPDAIWISHEHSDHFHEETLQQFDKNIPLYIPAFLNQRLEKRARDLGFKNIYVMRFGERMQLAKDFFITLYEPASLWNDAQALIEIDGFRILNINDSGINHRIHKEIQRVDCICAAFSPGASGYPATFTHLDREQKQSIYLQGKTATLEMLRKACELYNAQYFLPFASHFILNHPNHLPYMQIVHKNTLDDVQHFFTNSSCKVIDLLAGDSWEVHNKKVNKQERNKDLYSFSTIQHYIKTNFDEKEFLQFYPNKDFYRFDKKIVLDYFSHLNNIPEMIFCEDITVTVYPDFLTKNAFSFSIAKGVLQILDSVLESPNLVIKIPSEILMYICKNNESWDEATIGYWCEFTRNPDIYHPWFWRILQTPFYLKKSRMLNDSEISYFSLQSNVADILETMGQVGHKILARYGLYCLGCHKSFMETLEQACQMHGVDNVRMQVLLTELNIHYNDMMELQ